MKSDIIVNTAIVIRVSPNYMVFKDISVQYIVRKSLLSVGSMNAIKPSEEEML
jgi:hypothetical protein